MTSFFKSMKSLASLSFGKNVYDGKNNWKKEMGRFNDLTAIDIDGNELKLNQFDGKVLIITNVACKCGYTQGSYTAMEQLSIKYYDKGLRILCFPCNQFMGQEPWTEKEIKEWVIGKWPKLQPVMFSKIDINGDNTHKTYKFLKECFPGDINWNFSTKFVVAKNGIPAQRFDKNQTWEDIEKFIQLELDKPYQANKDDKEEQPVQPAEDEKTNDNQDEVQEEDAENEKKVEAVKDDKEEDTFDAKEFVEKTILEGPVVMISKSYCPFCKKAYEILSKYHADVIKKEIDGDEYGEVKMTAIQTYCKEKTGASSVPRVFIDGQFIGGCDDTEALDKSDKLKPLIEAAVNK